jgi:hypothetical protein
MTRWIAAVALVTGGISTACFAQNQDNNDNYSVSSGNQATTQSGNPPPTPPDQGAQRSTPPSNSGGDPNRGGPGVGVPTVHGCDSGGCWNNGPSTPQNDDNNSSQPHF